MALFRLWMLSVRYAAIAGRRGDFGPGVGEVELRTLQQRHVRHSSNRAGYGLGLSIVGTIVEKHGARLELMSPPPGAATGFEARILLSPEGLSSCRPS